MKTLSFLCILSVLMLFAEAQSTDSQFRNLQELESELAKAKTPEEKTDALISLYVYHAAHNEAINKKAAQDYQHQLEIFTHQTGKPELIARALHALLFTTRGEELKKRVDRLYNYAKLYNLDVYRARAKLREASHSLTFQSDHEKAVRLLNEGINIIKDLNDSLRTAILIQAGSIYNGMNNHLQALQFAFHAQEIASKVRSLHLLQACNSLFDEIYRDLKDYNKAIGYNEKILHQLVLLKKHHLAALRHARAASYYFLLEQPVIGDFHLKEAYSLADSVKGSKRLYNEITGTIVGTLSLSGDNEILTGFLENYRHHFFIFPNNTFLDNVTLARAYARVGKMDSARVLINEASKYFSDNVSSDQRRRYFFTLARIATHDKNWDLAVENYKKSLQITLGQNDLSISIEYADSLKNILVQQNNLPEAVHFYSLSDSLQSELTKQLDKEDITRQEIAALEKEKEFQALEKERQKNQRHNVQYLGITFGIVALFVALLLTGIFKVSSKTIKILSFFSFLLFFEFIFLIFKKQIAIITQGEPLKDLVFMVLLAAIMVPLHHWGEHKVAEYLSTKKIFPSKIKFSRGSATSQKEPVN